jgi:hypothetical protein
MSTQTFTEEQIAYITKQIKKGVREEFTRIIEIGLMYSIEVDKQMSGEKPSFKNAAEKAVPVLPEPKGRAELQTGLPFNPDLCNWGVPEGKEYENCRDGANFELLKNYLDAHNMKAAINGQFYWLFTRKDCIGRKLRGA